MSIDRVVAQRLVAGVHEAVASSLNESTLRHQVENRLEEACRSLGIPWTAFQLDQTLTRGAGLPPNFVDVAHGAVVIEYEAPRRFKGRHGAVFRHACSQAETYVTLLASEEGRARQEYTLVAWDGEHISFGRFDQARNTFHWEPLKRFDLPAAMRLLDAIRENGTPLVHPQLLAAIAGPQSNVGGKLLPALFRVVKQATQPGSTTSKAKLFYLEWRRLFGQIVGEVDKATSDRLHQHLEEIARAHNMPYQLHPSQYLFALHTYIALVAKLVAALSLPQASQDLRDTTVPLHVRLQQLESGQLFINAGVLNMLNGDFFAWYLDHNVNDDVDPLLWELNKISFDVTRKSADSVRDLFKGLYMTFVPEALRHALGEYYTPDWLAAHVLDTIKWDPNTSVIDPTCGSGTFLLEALRRRIARATPETSAADLLSGLYGLDLNPLAVLSTRASLLVFLSDRLDPANPVRLPVYLADSINPARSINGYYEHRLQTERGIQTFRLPAAFVEHTEFYEIMDRIRRLIDADQSPDVIWNVISRMPIFPQVSDSDRAAIIDTLATLVDLHRAGWNGIWCTILADRFAAGAIPPVHVIVGNPPWVKWSNLPREYADFIKPHCLRLGIFSDDTWVGGIESDISTVITYEAIDKYCKPGGVLAFLITGTVFTTESHQGFRRWRLPAMHSAGSAGEEHFSVVLVEDFGSIRPFEGVTNHPTLLVLQRNGIPTQYPVPYRVWGWPSHLRRLSRTFPSASAFRECAQSHDLLAAPVPGTDGGPWIKGTLHDHVLWSRLFAYRQPVYRARKGVTTDANRVFFVRVDRLLPDGRTALISTDPKEGRRPGMPTLQGIRVEVDHLFPLLRGRRISPFHAAPDPEHALLLPQRSMHGDPALPTTAPLTYAYLQQFQPFLENRSSRRRYQSQEPWWSVWSVGPYTFKPWKVVWKEMSGHRFEAAYVGAASVQGIPPKVIVPDHKVYFVPVESEDEAAYLTGLLNAPTIAKAVASYAAALSLGTSVLEYLKLPLYDQHNSDHQAIAHLAKAITHSNDPPTDHQWAQLDKLAHAILHIPGLPCGS